MSWCCSAFWLTFVGMLGEDLPTMPFHLGKIMKLAFASEIGDK